LLLLKLFRVSNSSSGTVQGLNFFFWRVQGDSFFTLAASEKGPARFQRKNANFTIKPCGQEATSRRGSEIASGVVQGLIFFFWDGSGSQLLLLKRFRVSNSSSGTVQGLNFFFWKVQGDSFFTLAVSEKGPARFQRKLQILLLSHVARRPLPGEVPKLLLGWFRVPLSSSGEVQGLTCCF